MVRVVPHITSVGTALLPVSLGIGGAQETLTKKPEWVKRSAAVLSIDGGSLTQLLPSQYSNYARSAAIGPQVAGEHVPSVYRKDWRWESELRERRPWIFQRGACIRRLGS